MQGQTMGRKQAETPPNSQIRERKTPHILLTGGTGLIGRKLGSALAQAGYTVTVLSRTAGELPFGKVLRWDGRTLPSEAEKEPLTAIIHLAGANIAERRWTEAYKQTLWESRVESTKAIADWLRKVAPHVHLVSASAVGYYGATTTQTLLTEESAPGKDFLAGLAQAWESAAWEAPQPPTIFRLGVVLSSKGGAWPKLRQAFRWGIGTYFAPGHQGFSWIHIADVVRAFLWALEGSERRGIYNLTAPEPLSVKAFATLIHKRLGGRWLLPLPESILRVALGEMADTLTKGAYVKPERLLREGFSFQYPSAESAIEALLQER
ncbi:MAG: TIGR01777 family oxidoreductase [Bacteroidia bacterium]|nr:TIGR01777 family oxidoreductase [Bacteroidia bacterium]